MSKSISSGRMVPLRRMYSSPVFRVSHFSPRITKLPFANTSITSTVIEPDMLLLWLAAALPENLLSFFSA
ncbi:Uncharacterised protein [Vibrio cholerae]|nr:Uncharacterised protein [Vibrio cholerae]